MNRRCYRVCELKNKVKAESTGWRSTFFYPGAHCSYTAVCGGGNYRGYWLQSQHHCVGTKESKNNLIYDGQWCRGKRHGQGMMRRRLADGTMERIYIGQWRDDMKCGEGKQFYANGVYYGWWQCNRRHGLGIMWYTSGNVYLGEWQADVVHGLGVMIYANGNRYEGHFARGYKNGEGTFYHMHTGQIQKGMWENDVCKASMVQDSFRNQADQATMYPIPPIRIDCPNEFIHDLFGKYIENANKPAKSNEELICLNFVHKIRQYAKFEPKAVSNSKIPFDDLYYPCTCQKAEKLIALREL